MKTIYVVHGSTGEYSDRGEWMVRAFTTKERAQAEVKRLEGLLQESGMERMSRYGSEWKAALKAFRQHDPRFDIDYTGTRWWVAECELVDAE